MPTYEYACRDCGHTFEVVQSMSDDPLTVCAECGGSLRKVFAPPAIAFKGSGFYATDHGKRAKPSERSGTAEKGSKDGGEGAGSNGSGSTGSEGGSGSSTKAAEAPAS